MAELENVAATMAMVEQSGETVRRAVGTEVSQERVAGSEREKADAWARLAVGRRQDTVEHFESGPVAADSDEVSVALALGGRHDLRPLSRCRGRSELDFEAGVAQSLEVRYGPLFASSTTSGWIEYCEEGGQGLGLRGSNSSRFAVW